MPDDFFCLDLGESFTKVVDVKKNGEHFEAQHMGLTETDPTFFRAESEKIIEKLGADIAKLITQLKITKKGANIVIPDSYTYNQFVETPKLNEKELLNAIKYQADQFIPMPLDEINLDIEIVHEDPKNQKVLTLIAAAPKKLVGKVEKLAEYAGIAPQSIETEMSAICRLATTVFRKSTGVGGDNEGVILLNLNFSTTSLYFFNQNYGTIAFTYNFNVGYNLFLKEIQVNLNVDQKKAIELLKTFGVAKNTSYDLNGILTPAIRDFLGEVQKAINLLKEKSVSRIHNIYVFNETFRFHSIEEIIGRYFGIPSSRLNLYPFFTRNNISDFFKNDFELFVASVGANLR